MTELQMQHAVVMVSVPIAQDDLGITSNVMALHPNGQIWPGYISREEIFTDGTVIYTVMFLDRSFSRVSLQNIHHRDNTVSYDNFGRTALRGANMNLESVLGVARRSCDAGSSVAGGSGIDSSGAASRNPPSASSLTGPFRDASRPPAVHRIAGSHVSEVSHDPAQGGAAASVPDRLLDWKKQADKFQRQRDQARLARDQHKDAHDTTLNTLIARTLECDTMHHERDAALDALDARDAAMQDSQDAHGAEGKKRKVDEPGRSVDWEQQACTCANERDHALESRNLAMDERDTALAWHHNDMNTISTLTTERNNMRNDRDTALAEATLATQRVVASDLRATAAEYRGTLMQHGLRRPSFLVCAVLTLMMMRLVVISKTISLATSKCLQFCGSATMSSLEMLALCPPRVEFVHINRQETQPAYHQT